MSNWTLLGRVWVDSGQLILTDPCYLSDWQGHDYADDAPGEYSFAGACTTTLDGFGGVLGGSVDDPLPTEGRAVAFPTGFGDGVYPVYGYVDADRVFGVFIDFGARDIDIDPLIAAVVTSED